MWDGDLIGFLRIINAKFHFILYRIKHLFLFLQRTLRLKKKIQIFQGFATEKRCLFKCVEKTIAPRFLMTIFLKVSSFVCLISGRNISHVRLFFIARIHLGLKLSKNRLKIYGNHMPGACLCLVY